MPSFSRRRRREYSETVSRILASRTAILFFAPKKNLARWLGKTISGTNSEVASCSVTICGVLVITGTYVYSDGKKITSVLAWRIA